MIRHQASVGEEFVHDVRSSLTHSLDNVLDNYLVYPKKVPPLSSETAAYADNVSNVMGMIALIPTNEDAERLETEWGFPKDRLHSTLWFLGNIEAMNSDHDLLGKMNNLRTALHDLVLQVKMGAVTGRAYSVGIANPTNPRVKTAITIGWSPHSEPPLVSLILIRRNIAQDFSKLLSGGQTISNEGDWAPHVTLGYVEDWTPAHINDAQSRLGDITFDRIRLALGKNIYDYSLV